VVQREGQPDAWRSFFAVAVAAVLGVPLVLFDFNYPVWASWAASVILCVALLRLLVFVTRKAQPDMDGDNRKDFIKSIQSVPFTVILGVLGIGLVVWACWVDLSKAQSAAWFVLSANLSAALAVSASAPLLFVGSKWWQFEMAKSTYQHTYTEAVSDSIREKRRNEKRTTDDWNSFRSRHFDWQPELEFTLVGRMAQFFAPSARKARKMVVETLKSISVAAGGESVTPAGKQQLELLLEGRSVAKRIRSLMENKTTQEKMVPKDEWEALAKVLESNTSNDRRIAAAYTKMGKLLGDA
jgi:hypothetical protein